MTCALNQQMQFESLNHLFFRRPIIQATQGQCMQLLKYLPRETMPSITLIFLLEVTSLKQTEGYYEK